MANFPPTKPGSVNTVESHHEKIKGKLVLKTAGELNLAAARWMLDNG